MPCPGRPSERNRRLAPGLQLLRAVGPALVDGVDDLGHLGVSASDEPVTRVVFDYEDEVTPSRAAAELGLSEAEFSVLLPVFSSKQLSTNFPLERDQFNVDFLGYACESQRALENIPAGCEGA